VSEFASAKARRVYAALERIGWQLKRQTGSHRVLARVGWPNYVFAFHDGDEIGPVMLRKIAQHTGLTPEDL
jgi:predicted RNA binding protein YcfA (HicA-like mRNA interferase family)